MATILGFNLLISYMQKSIYLHWKFLLILHTHESVMPSNKPCPSKHFKLPLSYSTCDTKPGFPAGKADTRGGEKLHKEQ